MTISCPTNKNRPILFLAALLEMQAGPGLFFPFLFLFIFLFLSSFHFTLLSINSSLKLCLLEVFVSHQLTMGPLMLTHQGSPSTVLQYLVQ